MADRSIAIIGLACRFPGSRAASEFWDNLVAGRECSTQFSDKELRAAGVPEAWLTRSDYVPTAYVLDDVEEFDNQLFECSARESELMDPQHRLFLEVAWEAFEDSGYTPNAVPGVVGAYVGAGGLVSSYLVDLLPENDDILGPTGSLQHIGNDKDFIATRASYKLDLKGPGVNVQSACSTSMLAVHLACQGLLRGECDMAIAGASTVRVPQREGYMAEEGGIRSPDGHCRPFDKDAGGTIFGSGVGAVVLKPLDKAIADGDNVYAVIRAIAATNDGARKVSYTATNFEGQARAITEALTLADVDPETIGYVEAHGTGTLMGDPIEIDALSRAFRLFTKKRQFCAIGSVKSNVGHLEQSAGMASLIKTALILKNGSIPPSINFAEPNPKIRFETSPFYVAQGCQEWGRSETVRRAGINSLGIGGTNVFTVLEEAPAPVPAENVAERDAHVLTLSAKSEAAMEELVRRYADRLGHTPDDELADLCFTANTGRATFEHRLYASGRSSADLAANLALAKLQRVARSAHGGAAKIAFLFTGQGAQYARMGADLYRSQRTFRKAIDECEALLLPFLGQSLAEILQDEEGTLLNRTEYAQPVLFALQYSLTQLLATWGVRPDFVMGHSVGEFAASCAAGVFDLQTGLRLITERARLMQAEPEGGEMAVVFADEAEVRATLARLASSSSVAAVNAPENAVISGEGEDVRRVLADFKSRRIGSRRLSVSHAFHSRLMDPMLSAFEEFVAGFPLQAPKTGYVSNLTGQLLPSSEVLSAGYFRRHVAEPVRFAEGMRSLYEQGCRVFIEVGPGTTLLTLGQQSVDDPEVKWLPTLRAKDQSWRGILATLGELFAAGFPVDWKAFDGDYRRRRVSAPRYPFQHKRFWLAKTGSSISRRTIGQMAGGQSLLGRKIPSPLTDVQFESVLSLGRFPALTDHRMYGRAVLPTTFGLEVAMSAAEQVFGPGRHVLEELLYREAIEVPEGDLTVHVVLTPSGDDSYRFQLYTLNDGDTPTWTKHIGATIRRGSGASISCAEKPSEIRARCAQQVPGESYYEKIDGIGLNYGPAFRRLGEVWRGTGEALAPVQLRPESGSYSLFDPVVMDGCLHLYGALFQPFSDQEGAPVLPTFLQISIERFQVLGPVTGALTSHVRLRAESSRQSTAVVDVTIFDEHEAIVAEIQGLALKRLAREDLFPSRAAQVTNWVYQVEWQKKPIAAGSALATVGLEEQGKIWIIFMDSTGVGSAIAEALRAKGNVCLLLYPDDVSQMGDDPEASKRPLPAHDFAITLQEVVDYDIACGGVIHLWGLDKPSSPDMPTEELEQIQCIGPGSIVQFIQALDAFPSALFNEARMWIATRGTQSVAEDQAAIRPEYASLWGIARTIPYEMPAFWGGVFDFDPQADEQYASTEAARILEQIQEGDGETEIAFRGDDRYVSRLVRLPKSVKTAPTRSIRGNATYLITGGLGVIGVKLTRLLYDRGARSFVLTGRRAPSPESEEAIRNMGLEGAQVRYVQMDVANRHQVEATVELIQESMPPLRGVFHSAGVLEDAILSRMPWEQFLRVMAPKVPGGWNLHHATLGIDLDHFVMFSGLVSVIGSAGSGNYTAGNAFLDSLGFARRMAGKPAIVFNWGPWAEQGLAFVAGRRGELIWAQRGTTYIPPDGAIELMDRLLDSGITQAAVTVTDWPVLVSQLSPENRTHFFDLLSEGAVSASGGGNGKTAQRLQEAAPEERTQIATEVITEHVVRTLGLDPAEFDTSQSISAYGLDSLLTLSLRQDLEDALGLRVPFALLLQGSVDDLVTTLYAG